MEVNGSRQAAKKEPNRAQMTRAELDTLVAGGRPTGKLLGSLAMLKGMTPESIARFTAVPVAMVRAIFDDKGADAVNKGTIRTIASLLGIDLNRMRFEGRAVHMIDYRCAPIGMGAESFRAAARAAGLLYRDARVVELKGVLSAARELSGARLFAAQNAHSRVLIYTTMRRRFGVEHVPMSAWARGSAEKSILKVENAELIRAIKMRDLTSTEFDELFMGCMAPTWESVRAAARINGVSKAALLEFIRVRGETLNQAAEGESSRPSLSVVHSAKQAELKAA